MNVSKLYWALSALGYVEEARRLRKEAVAARGGDREAGLRLEATASRLGWALAALGTSEVAVRLRDAAAAARKGDVAAQAYLDAYAAQHPWAVLAATSAASQTPTPTPTPTSTETPTSTPTAVPTQIQTPTPAPTATAAATVEASAETTAVAIAEAMADGPLPLPRSGGGEGQGEGAAPAATPTLAAPPEHAATTGQVAPASRHQFSLPRVALPRPWRRRGVKLVAGSLLGLLLAVGAAAGVRWLAVRVSGPSGSWTKGKAMVAAAWRRAGEAAARAARLLERPAPAPPEPAPEAARPARPPRLRPRAGKAVAADPAPAAGPGDAVAAAPPARDRRVWRAEAWGRTVDEVLPTVPGATRVAGSADADGLTPRAALEDVPFAGGPWSAHFLFDRGGRLRAIRLRPSGQGVQPGRAREEVAAALAARYGPPREAPPATGPGGAGSRSTWSTPDGLIELRSGTADLGSARVVAVDLEAGEVRPLPEQGVQLTVRPP